MSPTAQLPTQGLVQRAFIGGEIAPALYARADQAKYLAGLALCRNFIVMRHGGVTKRPGYRYKATTKDSTKAAKLRKFVFEAADQTYALEFGDGYIRFFFHGDPVVVAGVAAWNGATAYVVGDLVVSGGVNYYCILAHTNHVPPNATYWYALTGNIYEIPTPYAVADVPLLHTSQSADVLTLTHASYVPYELRRLGSTNWTLVALTTAPTIGPPTAGLTGSAGAAGALTMIYQIVSAKVDTYEKSYPSANITIAACAAPTTTAPNTLGWTAVAGVAEYYVFLDPVGNGIFGFIGVAASNSFKDPGFQPDYTVTPPVVRTLFNSTNNYPATSAYYQQRQWFARTNTNPEEVDASQVGAYHNFATTVPLEDDDAISFNLAGNHLNPVAHLIGLVKLLILTDEGEWVANGDDAGVIRPTAINEVQIGWIGASRLVTPEVVGNSCIYAQARGQTVRSLDFDQQQGTFAPKDLSLFASHLFEGYSILAFAFTLVPWSVLWVLRSDGVVLGLTYVKEQEVLAWHQHATDGTVEDILAVPDTANQRDVLYAVVNRTINATTKRYIELLESPFNENVDDAADAFYVDCGLTYDGAPATHFTGLGHLEAKRVAVLADGVVISDGQTGTSYTISGGALTPDLSVAASVVQIGLPITQADVQTLPIDVDGSAIRGKRKRLQALTAFLASSSAKFKAGPDTSNLIQASRERWQAADAIVTESVDISLTSVFDELGQTYIRHDQPLPFTLLGIEPEIEVSL